MAAIRDALPPNVPISEAIGQITAYDLFVSSTGSGRRPRRASTC